MNSYSGPYPLTEEQTKQIMFNYKEGVIDDETATRFLKLENAHKARQWLDSATTSPKEINE